MFHLHRKACALLLAVLLIPAGCQSAVSNAKTGEAGNASAPSAAAGTPPSSSDGSASQSAADSAASSGDGKTGGTAATSGSAAPAGGKAASGGAEAAGGISGTITAVRIASAQVGWVGGNGWIARTDDGGKHWHNQYVGGGTIRELFALNAKEAWAVTEKAGLLATTDGGKHWTAAGTAPVGFLHFVSKNEAFSAGAITVDGGKSWRDLPVPEHIVGEAYFHDKSVGWAVVQNGGEGIVERTTDGGKSWHPIMSRKLVSHLNGAVIRSAGTDDAWVEWIGDSGMTQTSYSLFHTSDGGKSWQTVLAKSTAGGGPAPGFPLGYSGGPNNAGSKPGPLYVVDRKTAYMGGECPACDKPNTVGHTTDGGKTWVNGKSELPGNAGALLAMADATHGWWIINDNTQPSVLYTTSDGTHWSKTFTFPASKKPGRLVRSAFFCGAAARFFEIS
ncbi:WD40/YVTN/BNR-like repeat-containing protein [Gordoniibacillus kamchatkensis]|uniref:WD40/YVTN/BNR-like repeat-containing protein n=1 Tax=Gordoniibacillus kamchatkensis TaxID=1590651 RepID=UPI000695B082|nr:hypothetical protein [Paenibacillus sp. VKM B-2647]